MEFKGFCSNYKSQSFFLSRYRFGTYIYNENTLEQIDLFQKLEEAKRAGKTTFDMPVLVGKKAQLPARLVAIRVSKEIKEERIRKAKNNRDKRFNLSKKRLELLEWTIYITNVDESIWKAKEIYQVYSYRWRIEIIFKCWKSHFNFERLFADKQSISVPRAIITFYLLLIWITLFFVRYFIYFEREIYKQKKCFISILKFASFISKWFSQLPEEKELFTWIERVAQYCKYDKRKQRLNQCQIIYYKK